MSDVRTELELPAFFDLYGRGEIPADAIDDYVDQWHNSYKELETYPPLHEYLGLTRDEYEVSLYDPFSLPCILQARQPGENLVDIMATRFEQLRVANRAEDRSIIFSLRNWLRAKAGH